MSEITRTPIVRVGVDLAKNVIQVHAVDAAGRKVVSKPIKRDGFVAWCAQLPRACLVAMEACSGAHHWARQLAAMGLDVRLIAASCPLHAKNRQQSSPTSQRDARQRAP